jgi:hypothetical protein
MPATAQAREVGRCVPADPGQQDGRIARRSLDGKGMVLFNSPPCRITSALGENVDISLDKSGKIRADGVPAKTETGARKMNADDEMTEVFTEAAFLLFDKLEREKGPIPAIPIEDVGEEIADISGNNRLFLKKLGFNTPD